MWKVLIAEDDFNSCEQLLDALEKRAECTTVRTGEEALTAYRSAVTANRPYDCILLDVMMPGKDGFSVLKAIRAEEEQCGIAPGSEVSIVMVTTYKDSLMDKYNMGWDDFLTKPIDKEKLISHMRSLLNKQKEDSAPPQ